jgi:hypothetical protein
MAQARAKRRKLAHDRNSDRYEEWILLAQDDRNWNDVLEGQFQALRERWWCPSQQYGMAKQMEHGDHFDWDIVGLDTIRARLDGTPSEDGLLEVSPQELGGALVVCDCPTSTSLTVHQSYSRQHTCILLPGSAFLIINLLPSPQVTLPAGWTDLLQRGEPRELSACGRRRSDSSPIHSLQA